MPISGRRPPFWNQLNGHIFATYERICTKFETDTKNKVLEPLLPSELIFDKIQDGVGRHIENYIFGHSSAIIAHIYTECDIQGQKKGFGRQSSYETSDVPKSKMALVAFWNQLNGNNSPNIEWIHTKFDIQTGNQVSF